MKEKACHMKGKACHMKGKAFPFMWRRVS
jgi:hypothetical protein